MRFTGNIRTAKGIKVVLQRCGSTIIVRQRQYFNGNSHSPQSLGLTLMLTQAHLQLIAANFNNIAGVNLPAFAGFYFAIHFYQTGVYSGFCFAATAKQALKFEYFI
jgi:hypothetical protein